MNLPDFCALAPDDVAKVPNAYFVQRINAGKP